MFNPQDFKDKIAIQVLDFIQPIIDDGWSVGLVGGIPRDYLMGRKLSKDYDFEITKKSAMLVADYDLLVEKLKSKFDVKELEYKVIRILHEGYDLEFTLPRIEVFNGDSGHKNFTAQFVDGPYADVCKRRDFTVNAIKIEFSTTSIELIDPLEGQKHLSQKLLVACNDDFKRDPLRFVRAFRFKYKLGFEFDSVLNEMISKASNLDISNHHLLQELDKSDHYFEMYRELQPHLTPYYPVLTPPLNNEFSDPLMNLMLSGNDWESCKRFIETIGLRVKKYQPLWKVAHILEELKTTEFSFDFMEFMQNAELIETCKIFFKALHTITQSFGTAVVLKVLNTNYDVLERMEKTDHPNLDKMQPKAREMFKNHHRLKVLYENQII
jgi:hypothetical protein